MSMQKQRKPEGGNTGEGDVRKGNNAARIAADKVNELLKTEKGNQKTSTQQALETNKKPRTRRICKYCGDPACPWGRQPSLSKEVPY